MESLEGHNRFSPGSSRNGACGGAEHLRFSRRTMLRGAGGLAFLSWLTPLSQLLAVEAEKGRPSETRARSVIIIWLAGGPSQIETFDPHPTSPIAYGTQGISTSLKGVQIAKGLEQTAGLLDQISLVRSVVSKEGDHERATYNIQTGYRPSPALVHPSIGAIINHELPDPKVEIPTHISILPGQWPARGGYFGAAYDAFKIGDPAKPIPDLASPIDQARRDKRLKDLDIIEAQFQKGRQPGLDTNRTLHGRTLQSALRMMTSSQVKAFDVASAPASERADFGDTAFGRGCHAALRLVQTGVRCVEITLNGWDTHTNNHAAQAALVKELDPAFAALIRGLKQRDLLNQTVVLCGGEFGRTPKLNALGGRDHWPHGFSVAMAGGGLKGGMVVGATDPAGESKEPKDPVTVGDIHTTILHSLGITPDKEIMTPIGRPMALSEGRLIQQLVS